MTDWKLLETLRARFLSEEPGRGGDYWTDEALVAYHATFAERIGWKWDAVLAELKARGWAPPSDEVLDWACGTGIASKRYLSFFPASRVRVWDRSAKAIAFTGFETARETPGVLLLSHVLSELTQDAEAELLLKIEKAAATIWVEPGTPALSARLISFRERLRDRFRVVAPCPHQGRCGLASQSRDWCHFFAPPPAQVFTTAFWSEFSRRLGIDLRSLPTSFLVLDSRPTPSSGSGRLVGRARDSKGYVRALVCRESGCAEERILDRRSPEAARAAREGGFCVRLP